jgi:Protein of unknown function (DUF3667)
MVEPVAVGTCSNCEAALTSTAAYCASCGQKACLPRLTVREIGHELMHALVHVDRSAVSLLRVLLLKPGIVAADYIAGRRKRYYGPFGFLVITVALASAVIAILGYSVIVVSTDSPVPTDAPKSIEDFLQRHANLIFCLQVPVLAGVCRIVALRDAKRYNYAEYLVIVSYTSGMHILFLAAVVVPGWYLLRSQPALALNMYYASLPVWPLYFGFAFSQFLSGPRWWSALRGCIAVVLSTAATLYAISELSTAYVNWQLRLGH